MPAKPGPLRPHEVRASYSRREPTQPPPGQPSLGDSFLIVTDVEVTERLYFESLRQALQITPLTVRVIHPSCTDAEGLVGAAIQVRNSVRERSVRGNAGSREVSNYDHVWVLFDTDVAGQNGQLQPALDLARRENIHVGHSTPSVEVWLLLHFRDRPGAFLNSSAVEHAVGDAWGQDYDKRAETFPRLWSAIRSRIPAAITRAKQVREYHDSARTTFPANPSTQLDLLVRALDSSVQPAMRILR